MEPVLKDFWESHRSDYLVDYSEDVSKSFLLNLAHLVTGAGEKRVTITSVHRKKGTVGGINDLIRFSRSDKLNKLYGNRSSKIYNANDFNMWYTGENFRPPFDAGFDAYLSYDIDSFSGLNYYLPLWVCRLGPSLQIADQAQRILNNFRAIGPLRNRNFAVVASNPERIRNFFIKNLQQYSDVDIYGKTGLEVVNKNQTLQNYNFNICFENDLYPGYVTEKAIESYLSGCIPVWRGLDEGGFLNKDAIIDVTDLSFADATQKVLDVSKDKDLIQHMRCQPILRATIPLDKIVATLQEKYQSS